MSADNRLETDVGQLLWYGFEGTVLPGDLAGRIAEGLVGGVILFKRNLVISEVDGAEVIDIDALVELNESLHRAVGEGLPRLLIAVDQEGGRVQRLRAPATRWPAMHAFASLPNGEAEALAERTGEAMGRELAAVGFDVDFAPVLDVHTNPDNPIIGDRSFSTLASAATSRALAFARGLERAGLISCGKHFPGHGDTSTDSHLALPRLDHDIERLREVELAPFRAAAAAGLPTLMTAHVVFAALDPDVPATLSARVVTELLRGELGYEGVVISDDLDMNAIAENYGVGDAAVRAIEAGCDVLLLCRNPEHQQQAFDALMAKGASDSTTRARIGEAAERVRRLKREHNRDNAIADRSAIGSQQAEELAAQLRSALG